METKDYADLTISEIEKKIKKVKDSTVIEALINVEKENKNRVGAIEVLEARLEKLAKDIDIKESKELSNEKKLPAYESVKKVRALKIKEVRRNPDGTAELTPEEKGYEPFTVSSHYMRRHNARAGGYYIVYENGTPSFQAAVFFEEGYQKSK